MNFPSGWCIRRILDQPFYANIALEGQLYLFRCGNCQTHIKKVTMTLICERISWLIRTPNGTN